MLKNILNLIYGAVFGIANVIPGVSGGTMMVVFGVYDKLLKVLSFKLSEIKKNIVFLIFFGIGAVLGILGFSYLITWLLDNFPVATNMFFMGLIAGSIPLIYRNGTAKGKKVKPSCLLAFIPALALVVGLAVLDKNVTGEGYTVTPVKTDSGYSITIENSGGFDMKSSWQMKIDGTLSGETENCAVKKSSDSSFTLTGLDNSVIESGKSITIGVPTDGEITADSISFSYTYKMDILLFITLLAGLTVAALAMIIPGVSGSFVMVLLGLYATVIGAIKSLDIVTLIPVAMGVVIGIVFGAKLISALLKKYSLMVYSAIMGLVIGSLYAVLPEGVGFNLQTLIGVFALMVGAAIALVTGKYTKVE